MAENHKSIEVHVEKQPQKTRKWQKLWGGVFAFFLMALVVFQLVMLGFNLGRHNYDNATVNAITAAMFGFLLLFQWLDMSIDARMGREAMKALRATGEMFDVLDHVMRDVAEHMEAKPVKTNSLKKYATPEAKREAHNARRRAARAADKKNVTAKKTAKK